MHVRGIAKLLECEARTVSNQIEGCVEISVLEAETVTEGGLQGVYLVLGEDLATLLEQIIFSSVAEPTRRMASALLKKLAAAGFKLAVMLELAPQKLLEDVKVATSDQARILELEQRLLETKSAMLTIHGAELGALILGKQDQIVKVKEVSTEIVNPATGRCDNVLTADQFKSEVQRKTGQKPKSLKAFIDKLKAEGRDDLTIAVTRHSTCEYVAADKLDEAIGVVYGHARQLPVVTVGSLVVKV